MSDNMKIVSMKVGKDTAAVTMEVIISAYKSPLLFDVFYPIQEGKHLPELMRYEDTKAVVDHFLGRAMASRIMNMVHALRRME